MCSIMTPSLNGMYRVLYGYDKSSKLPVISLYSNCTIKPLYGSKYNYRYSRLQVHLNIIYCTHSMDLSTHTHTKITLEKMRCTHMATPAKFALLCHKIGLNSWYIHWDHFWANCILSTTCLTQMNTSRVKKRRSRRFSTSIGSRIQACRLQNWYTLIIYCIVTVCNNLMAYFWHVACHAVTLSLSSFRAYRKCSYRIPRNVSDSSVDTIHKL